MADKKKEMQISVTYSFIDDAHFFTSKDVKARGLCVASKDLATAFNEVSFQLKTLLHENEGIEANCQSMLDFEELKEWVNKEVECSKREKINDFFIPVPTARMGWTEGKAA